MNPPRTRVLVALLAISAIALLGLTVAGLFPGAISDDPIESDAENGESENLEDVGATEPADRPDDPSTTDTVGYVEGYWYDDDLDVDDRKDAVVSDDELDAVVYRSMARVEVIRNLTFEGDVPVDVISREEFQDDNDDLFVDVTADEHLQQNVNYEALFMVDRDTDALDEVEALYGGAVGGYYDPAANEVVLVSDSPETPELDEVILGHELLHALQDQHFDLQRYDRETIDQDNAKNGLIEGDATFVENEYDDRCDDEWDCLVPGGGPEEPPEPNWGIYLTVFQPYDDGPDYVEYLLERGGWDAVDDAYDDPPASSSEVIRPGEEREPADIEVADDSSDEWQQLDVDGGVATETVGEAGMVAMFGGGAFETGEPTVLEQSDLVGFGLGFEYDQPYTDGWAGDELVTYVHDDGLAANETADAVDHTGYVWQTEWTDEANGQQFVTGYLELLDGYGAESVADRQDTFEIDDEDGYPGAYYIDHDGETVTIVRAPSVDALDAIESGAAPEGEDTLDSESAGDESEDEAGGDDTDETAGTTDQTETGDESDGLAGVAGSVPIVAAVVLGTVSVLVVGRSRRPIRSRAER